MSNRDWNDNPLAGFGALISAMGGGGDRGNMFPQSDADDFASGARFVPGEVTLARRRGEKVNFVHTCSPCCWYWEFEDGTRVYHWDRFTWQYIAEANGHTEEDVKEAGPCPRCGNVHTNGGTVKPS